MNMIESVKTCLSKYAVFDGRATRSEFWWFFLFQVILNIVTSLLDGMLFPPAMAQTAAEATGQMMDAGNQMMAATGDGATMDSVMTPLPAGPTPILSTITGLALMIPGLAVSARRLHDVNKSGWWYLLCFTIIGLIPLIFWWVKKGDDTENRFGKAAA